MPPPARGTCWAGTIGGGTVTGRAAASTAFTTSGGTLAGVTFDNNLDLASVSDANATVTSGLTLAGGATVYLGNVSARPTRAICTSAAPRRWAAPGPSCSARTANNSVYETASAETLTIAPGVTIRGSAGTIGSYYSNDTVVNQGTIAADDSGGLTTPFVYDTDYSGGFTGSTAAVVSTSGVTNPAPQAVYQTYRAGAFTYTLTGLTPSASYTLRLHFADPSSTAAGQRQFDVSVNGTAVLTNFDVFAAAGGENKAVVKSLTATANAQGDLVITFAYGAAGTPFVNGIDVDSGSTIVQAINCGELAGGTITVDPTTFTNQGTLKAQNGDTLSIGGAGGQPGTATISGRLDPQPGRVQLRGRPGGHRRRRADADARRHVEQCRGQDDLRYRGNAQPGQLDQCLVQLRHDHGDRQYGEPGRRLHLGGVRLIQPLSGNDGESDGHAQQHRHHAGARCRHRLVEPVGRHHQRRHRDRGGRRRAGLHDLRRHAGGRHL